jgi:hypothetical protein
MGNIIDRFFGCRNNLIRNRDHEKQFTCSQTASRRSDHKRNTSYLSLRNFPNLYTLNCRFGGEDGDEVVERPSMQVEIAVLAPILRLTRLRIVTDT